MPGRGRGKGRGRGRQGDSSSQGNNAARVPPPPGLGGDENEDARDRSKSAGGRKKGRGGKDADANSDKGTASAGGAGSDTEDHVCLVCMEPIERFCVPVCGHRSSCHHCALRLRLRMGGDDRCTLCREPSRECIVTKDATLSFRDLKSGMASVKGADGGSRGAQPPMRGPKGLLFATREDLDAFRDLTQAQCSLCGWTGHGSGKGGRAGGATFEQLQEHLKKAHGGSAMCSLCETSGNLFMSEMEVFESPEALERHCQVGDESGDSPFRGHPRCEFCNTYHYDADALWKHLKAEHHHCHCCGSSSSGEPVYFPDMDALVSHYEAEHFVCEYGSCGGARAHIVFATEEERKRHYKIVHSDKMTKFDRSQARTMEGLGFTVRRGGEGELYGSDGGPSAAGRGRGRGKGRGRGRGSRDAPPPAGSSSSSSSSSAAAAAAAGAGDQTQGGTVSVLTAQREAAAVQEEREAHELKMRNRALVKVLRNILGPDREDDYLAFRKVSAEFRDGRVPVDRYYSQISHLFGSDYCDAIVPGLCALLPDERKRGELDMYHTEQGRLAALFPSLPRDETRSERRAREAASPGRGKGAATKSWNAPSASGSGSRAAVLDLTKPSRIRVRAMPITGNAMHAQRRLPKSANAASSGSSSSSSSSSSQMGPTPAEASRAIAETFEAFENSRRDRERDREFGLSSREASPERDDRGRFADAHAPTGSGGEGANAGDSNWERKPTQKEKAKLLKKKKQQQEQQQQEQQQQHYEEVGGGDDAARTQQQQQNSQGGPAGPALGRPRVNIMSGVWGSRNGYRGGSFASAPPPSGASASSSVHGPAPGSAAAIVAGVGIQGPGARSSSRAAAPTTDDFPALAGPSRPAAASSASAPGWAEEQDPYAGLPTQVTVRKGKKGKKAVKVIKWG